MEKMKYASRNMPSPGMNQLIIHLCDMQAQVAQ